MRLLTCVKRTIQEPLKLLRKEARQIRGITPDRHLAVFGSARNGFGDNAAHLFLAMSSESDMRCVWISGSRQLVARLRERGFRAEYRWSLRGFLTSVHAGWVVVNSYTRDVHVVLGRRAMVLNLWHGLPLKKIEHDLTDPVAQLHHPLLHAVTTDLRPPDFVLSTTPTVSRHFSTAFRVPEARCLELGYPRCDPLFSRGVPDPLLVRNVEAWKRLRDAPFVVGYFPTWRDDGRDFISTSGLSLPELAQVVSDEGGAFVGKLHPLTAQATYGVPLLDDDDDLSSFLPLCTLLITDYSSVAFDFLLLDRPLIYYVPDIDNYRVVRGFYFSPDEAMPGPLIRQPDDLLRSVRDTIRAGFHVSEGAAEVRTRFWGDDQGGASRRIAQFMLDWPG
jgi:CDP-glycerol glycerophosphotransferase (TagB/SpsB family)